MNGNSILIDSNIIIYLSKNKISIDDVFEKDKKYYISLVSYMEILSYNFISKDEEKFINKLLSFFEIIDISKDIANKVISLKKSRKIKLPDAIIVATSMIFNHTLFTNDKQLTTIDGLKVKYFEIE